MTAPDARSLPLDPTSVARLADRGLSMTLLDPADEEAFDAWLRADILGFHDVNHGADVLARMREGLGYRRTTAVLDPTLPRPQEPVGTVSSWVADLTVSPGRTVDAWAISSVTVRPTHTGRGIARAMLEGELRLASEAGVPIAALTVSESTLYGRYGFGPAAFEADATIRTARAAWTGPVPAGVVDVIDAADWRDRVAPLYERVRIARPGHVDMWALRFEQAAGLAGDDPDASKRLKAAAYLDEAGELRGLLLYRISGGESDFVEHRLTVESLITETDDASAALWRYALQMPLVHEVLAPMRSSDEPVRWQIADYRAARVGLRDMLWLRILDVPRSLTARQYDVPGRVSLRVSDRLGFAAGSWRLEVDESGNASVVPDDTPHEDVLDLDVSALSSLYLGGASAGTLARAGRISGSFDAVRRAEAVFGQAVVPWLPFWF